MDKNTPITIVPVENGLIVTPLTWKDPMDANRRIFNNLHDLATFMFSHFEFMTYKQDSLPAMRPESSTILALSGPVTACNCRKPGESQ